MNGEKKGSCSDGPALSGSVDPLSLCLHSISSLPPLYLHQSQWMLSWCTSISVCAHNDPSLVRPWYAVAPWSNLLIAQMVATVMLYSHSSFYTFQQ